MAGLQKASSGTPCRCSAAHLPVLIVSIRQGSSQMNASSSIVQYVYPSEKSARIKREQSSYAWRGAAHAATRLNFLRLTLKNNLTLCPRQNPGADCVSRRPYYRTLSDSDSSDSACESPPEIQRRRFGSASPHTRLRSERDTPPKADGTQPTSDLCYHSS